MILKRLPRRVCRHKKISKEFANRSLFTSSAAPDTHRFSSFNGLIVSHLALKVPPQETHSIVLKKKVTTTY